MTLRRMALDQSKTTPDPQLRVDTRKRQQDGQCEADSLRCHSEG